MKQLLPSLITVASLLMALNASAAVQLMPSATTVNVNESFTVDVQATALTNIDSASVKFTYDQRILRLDGITLAGGAAAFCDLVIRDANTNDGLVDSIFAITHNPTGEACPALSGNFLAFQFQMTALTVGNSSLAMTQNATGYGWTSEDLPGAVLAAADTTASPVGITVITPDADADGIPDNLDNCPVTSNVNQNDANADGIGDACQCGDISGDGKITNTDSVLIKRHLLGLPSKFDVNFCDVNGDGLCTNTDAVLIQRTLLGLPPGLAQTCAAAVN